MCSVIPPKHWTLSGCGCDATFGPQRWHCRTICSGRDSRIRQIYVNEFFLLSDGREIVLRLTYDPIVAQIIELFYSQKITRPYVFALYRIFYLTPDSICLIAAIFLPSGQGRGRGPLWRENPKFKARLSSNEPTSL